MTKTQAIRHARANVSELFRFGDGWKFSVYDPGVAAWRESGAYPYHDALVHRARSLIECAARAMGLDDMNTCAASYAYEGGRWTDYVPATH